MPRSFTNMECFNILSITLLILTTAVFELNSEEIAKRNEGSLKPPLVVNPIEHLTLNEGNVPKPERSLARDKRQSDITDKQSKNNKSNDVDKPKPPPDFNPLENLILNQDKNGFKPGASLSRVKRQYSDSESDSIESEENVSGITNNIEDDGDYYGGRYPYPYPIPIFIGGGFGGFGGRGFGGGFGGRGYGGRGFGGGFGGRGFGGGFGGRGVGGGFGGGRGGGGGRG